MRVLEELGIDNLKIYQDDTMYRFTSDAILLSRFASNRKGEVVGDFCSGSGIVGLHYYALHKNIKSLDFFEIQEELAKMNIESLEINNLDDRFTVHNTRLQDIDNTFNNKFSLILCNPPYKRQNSGEKSELTSLAICKHEVTITLEEIIQIASKKLKYGGRLCICQRIERLNDCIYLMRENKIEPNVLQFITTKEDGLPYLFLIEGTYGLKPQLKVLNNKVNG